MIYNNKIGVNIECIILSKLHLKYNWRSIMFKIEKQEMTNKTFRLPLKLVQKMQTIAQNKGISLNNLVLQCCEYALKHLEK